MASTEESCPAKCNNGAHFVTESEHVSMLKAVRGTGRPIRTSFGFGGGGRVWIDCPWCKVTGGEDRELILDTIDIWLEVKRDAK
jgi:hypothetical protein